MMILEIIQKGFCMQPTDYEVHPYAASLCYESVVWSHLLVYQIWNKADYRTMTNY